MSKNMDKIKCVICSTEFTSKNGLRTHEKTKKHLKKVEEMTIALKTSNQPTGKTPDSLTSKKTKINKKESIPKTVRNSVWNRHIGAKKGTGDCYVGCGEQISKGNFECGHIIAEKCGGTTSMDNLRPICSLCNKSMGTNNMNEFMEKYGFKEMIQISYSGKEEEPQNIPIVPEIDNKKELARKMDLIINNTVILSAFSGGKVGSRMYYNDIIMIINGAWDEWMKLYEAGTGTLQGLKFNEKTEKIEKNSNGFTAYRIEKNSNGQEQLDKLKNRRMVLIDENTTIKDNGTNRMLTDDEIEMIYYSSWNVWERLHELGDMGGPAVMDLIVKNKYGYIENCLNNKNDRYKKGWYVINKRR